MAQKPPATPHPPARQATASAPRALGPETLRSHARRVAEGFYDRYLGGDHVLDIGFRGGRPDAVPVTDKAIGVELDYPGYDGTRLPFADGSQDAIFVSHCLEHISNYQAVLADWFRVLKIGGYLVIAVPHQQLYERKSMPPSRFNGDHKRFYTPSSLLLEIDQSLPLAAWRLRSLRDVDDGFSYTVGIEDHAKGCYEIELVIEKIATPAYAGGLRISPEAQAVCRFFAEVVARALNPDSAADSGTADQLRLVLAGLPLPPYNQIEKLLPADLPRGGLAALLRPLIESAPFNETDYLMRYPDIREAVRTGAIASGLTHYAASGYFEGRFATPVSPLFA